MGKLPSTAAAYPYLSPVLFWIFPVGSSVSTSDALILTPVMRLVAEAELGNSHCAASSSLAGGGGAAAIRTYITDECSDLSSVCGAGAHRTDICVRCLTPPGVGLSGRLHPLLQLAHLLCIPNDAFRPICRQLFNDYCHRLQ